MRASNVHAAKRKALSELIHQMRKMELRGSSAKSTPVDLTDDDDMLDMSDDETDEGSPAEEQADLHELDDDPKAQLEEFMKKGGKRPSRSRATVVMAVKSSPASKMMKTFGKK